MSDWQWNLCCNLAEIARCEYFSRKTGRTMAAMRMGYIGKVRF